MASRDEAIKSIISALNGQVPQSPSMVNANLPRLGFSTQRQDTVPYGYTTQAAYGISNAVTEKLADILGVHDTVKYAMRRPSEIGVTWGGSGKRDYEDALRHILLAAELKRTRPLLAEPLLWAHEVSGDILGQSKEAREMDDYNNKLGVAIGRKSKSVADSELQSLNALPRAIANVPKEE